MLSLKSTRLDDLSLINTVSHPKGQQELAHWEQLEFSFDMDNEPRNSSSERTSRTQRSTSRPISSTPQPIIPSAVSLQDAALLAQFAASPADSVPEYNHLYSQGQYQTMDHAPGFYGNFLQHNNAPHHQLPPLSSLDFPWNISPHDQAGPSQYNSQQLPTAYNQPGSHFGALQTHPNLGLSNSPLLPQHQASATNNSPEVDHGEPASAEEKRRRNTAASARFRIKKKQRATNLERSVSDLTSRAEELEREVADLRRENGWLKEIVMLKGTQFAASNLSTRLAQNQAALDAATSRQAAEASRQQNSNSNTQSTEDDDSSSSEEEVEEERKNRNSKAKAVKGKR